MTDALMAELTRVHARSRTRLDEALDAMARWIEEHPDATVEELEATPEHRDVLRAFDAEVTQVEAVLVESLPAMVDRRKTEPKAVR